MKKSFPICDVMSVVTRRHLSPALTTEYELLAFLCGMPSVSQPSASLYEAAQRELYRQHPRLADGHMQFAMGELILFLETPSGKAEPDKLILGWLSTQSARLGADTFEIHGCGN